MFPLTITMTLQLLLIVLVISTVSGQDRKIVAQLNPGCEVCSTEDTLVYIRAQGSNNTIHQIWDFTKGVPTVIFTIASLNSSITVSWDGSDPNGFVLNEKPKYSFAAAIDKLIEYDDIEDNGHIDPHCPQREYSLKHLSWERVDSVLTDKEALLQMTGKLMQQGKAGTIHVKLDLLPFQDYAVELPHLIHTANSTLVDVSLVNLTSARDYNASRFALHLTLASTDPRDDTMHYAMRKSLDDEHTPGIFEIMEIKTPESYRRDDGGFVQFRPVGYTQTERTVSTSTIAHVSDLTRTSLPKGSTLKTFYKYFDPSNLLVQDLLISFGESGDGYYKQHNYTAWSFTIGYGTPPVENVSLFVVMIICIGLGVPIALALSGAVYVVARRCRQRNAPRRLTDDD